MGVDWYKCDMCVECYPDCGDNIPQNVEGTNKSVCPECMSKWLDKQNIKLEYVKDKYGDEYEMYFDPEEGIIKKEFNPFKNELFIDIDKLKEIIGEITLIRGITHECQIHNAVNNERKRILDSLINKGKDKNE